MRHSVTSRFAAVSLAVLAPCMVSGALTGAAHAAPAPTRTITPLAKGWRFHLGDAASGVTAPGFDDAAWDKVDVPHSWNRVGYYLTPGPDHINRADTVNAQQGLGWYRLHFQAPASAKGREFWLEFDAASRVAEVWVNGRRLGAHAGGFSRFRFDASGAVHRGQDNLLAVKVDNSVPAPANATADTLPLAGDFFVHGGLYRPVRLITTAPVHFDMLDHGGAGVYPTNEKVTAEAATVHISARLANDGASPLKGVLQTRLVDASGAVVAAVSNPVRVAAGASVETVQRLHLNHPHLWQGVEDPYLYHLISTLRTPGGRVIDQIDQTTGLRDIRIDPEKGLFLNGRHVALHGVSRHQDKEGKGWALSSADEDEDVALIREMGANTIRLAHYQQSQHINDLADRYGLILWDEIPLVSKWTLGAGKMTPSEGLVEDARQQLTELIRQNIHHPAVAVWSIANEVDFGMPIGVDFSQNTGEAPDPRPLLKTLNALAKSEDPSRPTTLATCCEDRAELPGAKPPVVAGITDVFGANRYYGWYYGSPKAEAPYLDLNHSQHPNNPISVSEYGAGGAVSQQTDNPEGGRADYRGRAQPEGYESYVHEKIWSDFSKRPYLWATWVWNMFDFATTIRREGDAMDINTKGLITYDRKVKKDAFYFYKANWSSEPVVYLTGRRYVDRAYGVVDVSVYSNAQETSLKLNGADLGARKDCDNHVCVWREVRLAVGDNHLTAQADFAGRSVTDTVAWTLSADAASHIRIACGAMMGRDTSLGRFGSDAFFVGGEPASLIKSHGFALGPTDPKAAAKLLPEASDPDLIASFREGDFRYDIPMENGEYQVTLTFVAPADDVVGARIFDVTANGAALFKNLDIAAQAGGVLKPLQQTFPVTVRDGRLNLGFHPSLGKALVSAISISR